MDWEKLPKIIKEVALDFEWDNEKVWQLKAEVEKISLSELEWQLDIPFWDTSKERYVLTPNEVMNNPEKYAEQYKRIMNADLNYPIDIMKNRKGLWECLDGLHRVAKAKVLGMNEVEVRKISQDQIPLILKEKD